MTKAQEATLANAIDNLSTIIAESVLEKVLGDSRIKDLSTVAKEEAKPKKETKAKAKKETKPKKEKEEVAGAFLEEKEEEEVAEEKTEALDKDALLDVVRNEAAAYGAVHGTPAAKELINKYAPKLAQIETVAELASLREDIKAAS